MRLPRPAQQYERTCTECGCTWRVPRQFARRHMQGISTFHINAGSRATESLPGVYGGPSGSGFDKAELDREIQSNMEIGEQTEAFRRCPDCGSEHYSQRPVRS
jgi:hypothetical protein